MIGECLKNIIEEWSIIYQISYFLQRSYHQTTWQMNEFVGLKHLVGNTVIDAVKLCMPLVESNTYHDDNTNRQGFFSECVKLKNNPSSFVLLTLHREENVDNRDSLKCILTALSTSRLDCICPMHPRTVKRINEFNLEHLMPNKVIPPVNYFDFLRLA